MGVNLEFNDRINVSAYLCENSQIIEIVTMKLMAVFDHLEGFDSAEIS